MQLAIFINIFLIVNKSHKKTKTNYELILKATVVYVAKA